MNHNESVADSISVHQLVDKSLNLNNLRKDSLVKNYCMIMREDVAEADQAIANDQDFVFINNDDLGDEIANLI